MPFTDPMADGPKIQAGGLRALKAGATTKKTLALVKDFRKTDDTTPVVLMGYYNPIYVYGVDKFLKEAKAAGADGLIIVDLPPEEDDELRLPARWTQAFNFIRLTTPTTDDARAPRRVPEHQRFRLLCVRARHHRHQGAGPEEREDQREAPEETHQAADLRGLRRQDGGNRPGPLPKRLTVLLSVPPLFQPWLIHQTKTGKATPKTAEAVHKLVKKIAKGVRGVDAS